MLDNKHVKAELSRFAKSVIRSSKRNLTSMGKSTSGRLKRSLKSTLTVSPNSFDLEFEMENYGEYQDKGVSGTKKKYNTPFKYTTKMPPSSAFNGWAVRKGLAPRDSKGKFLKRKSLNFLIARSVFENGIKPSLFFTKPFNKQFSKLPDDLLEAYGLDAEKFLQASIDNKK